MKKLLWFLPFCLLGGVALFAFKRSPAPATTAKHAQAAKKPNVILIMSDDMGFSDLGCYGGEARTPNLDMLAATGIRYTQFYNTARCCPSRASLMTGLDPHQAGMGWMTTDDFKLPGYRGDLSHNAVTIAEALKSSGYATYMTGKWHLNLKPTPQTTRENWPLQRGFDKYYGIILGAANYFDPGYLCRDNKLITPYTDSAYQAKNYYLTDAIADNSVKYIEQRNKQKPFFMYVAFTAAHWPMQAPEDEIAKYKGRFNGGYDKLRSERLVRMKKMGLVDKNVEMGPFEGIRWENEKEKPAMLRRMETYAAMIDRMDQGIGRIIAQLKKDGIYDNTVILFLQDNGACAEIIGDGAVRPQQRHSSKWVSKAADELTYTIDPAVTRDGKPVMQGRGVMAGPPDTYVSYFKVWASVSNTPLRKFKHYVHEGGISTPLIVHWPAGIKQQGGFCRQPGHEMDIMPTILDITGTTYPTQYNGNSITPCEGISLVPSFTNKPLKREAIYWEHEMNRAVRMGNWKLVSEADLNEGKREYVSQPWELYDLAADRSEMHNLAAQHPDLVKKMSNMWQAYALRCNVLPSPWKPKQGK